MMSLWDALRMNMMISYQELVRTFPSYYFVLFHIFAGKPRSRAQKQGLYRRLCARLDDEMAVSPQDVMVVIQFNQLEDWSFSAGKMAGE